MIKKPFAAYPQRRAFIIWIVPVANQRKIILSPPNPLIQRIKGDQATVIKLLSKELLRSRKALILLDFSAFWFHSHSRPENESVILHSLFPLFILKFSAFFEVKYCASQIVVRIWYTALSVATTDFKNWINHFNNFTARYDAVGLDRRSVLNPAIGNGGHNAPARPVFRIGNVWHGRSLSVYKACQNGKELSVGQLSFGQNKPLQPFRTLTEANAETASWYHESSATSEKTLTAPVRAALLLSVKER